jgi:phosphatidate phosphatase APP1
MARLVTELTTADACDLVVYLASGPRAFAGPLAHLLQRCGFPQGAVLVPSDTRCPRGGLDAGRSPRHDALEWLAETLPSVRWMLIGDDLPRIREDYTRFAQRRPASVAAIGLLTVAAGEVPEGLFPADRVGPVPIVRAPGR